MSSTSTTPAAGVISTMSTATRTASCVCGNFKLHIQGNPAGRISVCHCFACQQRTGSVFGCQTRFLVSQVTEQGESKVYTRIGDSGGRIDYKFCPNCGSTLCWNIRYRYTIAICL